MQLIDCAAPEGVLEPAPRSSLEGDVPGARCQAFWAQDDRYYVRTVDEHGRERWLCLEDSSRASAPLLPAPALVSPSEAPRPRRTLSMIALSTRARCTIIWTHRRRHCA